MKQLDDWIDYQRDPPVGDDESLREQVGMLDASGLFRIRYGDIFRAVGHFLDTSFFRDLTLVETPEGFIVKGGAIQAGEARTTFVPRSYLFTDSDLDRLLDQAIERRGAELGGGFVAAVDLGRWRAGALRGRASGDRPAGGPDRLA